MGAAKEIIVKVIPPAIANDFIKKHHYSGKVVQNSALHFGAFLGGKLHGVLSYGPSMDKSKIMGLVRDTGWNEFIELNRITLRMIKKNAPQIKWVISFADGCSCGDGTIYRASNFVLTGIKENKNLCILPNGEKIHKMTLESRPTAPRKELDGKSYYEITGGQYSFRRYVEYVGGEILEGYQLRYIYFIDKAYRARLTVPEIPFSKIDEVGAGMYKGEKITQAERHVDR